MILRVLFFGLFAFPFFNISLLKSSKSQCSPSTFVQQAKFQSSDVEAGDAFGVAISIDGDTVIAGVKNENTGGTDTGSAYIFTRSGTTWTQQQKIQAADKHARQDFGSSVAISGETVIISAPEDVNGGANNDIGAAYIYTRSGGVWTQQQKIRSADVQMNDEFGHPVAIDGDTAVGSALLEDTNGASAGSVYIFTRSGTTWTQQQKIQSSDVIAGDQFGRALAIDGDTLVVGVSLKDTGGTNAGAVYVFTRTGGVWSEQQKIQSTDIEANDGFGAQIAIEGDTLVVGVPGEDTGATGAGAVYIFTRSSGTWTQQQKIQASDLAEYDAFGSGVAIEGNTLVIGAYSEDTAADGAGSVYVFSKSGGTWSEQQKFQAGDAEATDLFGYAVSLNGGSAFIGAIGEDTNGSGAGAGYIFTGNCP